MEASKRNRVSNALWMDASSVLGWTDTPTGVVRTEARCLEHALKFLSTGPSIRFCRFASANGKMGFKEVSAQDVHEAVQRLEKRTSSTKGTSPRTTTYPVLITMRDKIVSSLSRYLSALSTSHRGEQANPARLGTDTGCGNYFSPFAENDTYISLGIMWNRDALKVLHEEKLCKRIHVLLFCHDVIPVKFPHLCIGMFGAKFAMYLSNVAKCANKVLSNSECSRRDFLKLLQDMNIPAPPVSVVKLGCNIPESHTTPSEAIAGFLPDKYILYVSTIERRKNHEVLYRAYTRLVDMRIKKLPLLLFVGKKGWGVKDLLRDLRLDPRVKSLITILDEISDSDLAHLYRNCWITAFPSLYEGWGLPVGESLSVGKFCIASDAESIQEIGGDLIDYLDPWDVNSWVNRILLYLNSPQLIIERENMIRTKYKKTSWEEAARSILYECTNI